MTVDKRFTISSTGLATEYDPALRTANLSVAVIGRRFIHHIGCLSIDGPLQQQELGDRLGRCRANMVCHQIEQDAVAPWKRRSTSSLRPATSVLIPKFR
jgi:hypothetical protein